MEREIEQLLEIYTISEILEMFSLDEKEVLLALVDEGILELDMETIVKHGIQIEPGPVQDTTSRDNLYE